MFKTPINETDYWGWCCTSSPYPPFFKFLFFALTSDLISVLSFQFKRRVLPGTIQMELVLDKQSFSTYTRNWQRNLGKSISVHVFDRCAFCSFFGGCYFIFFKHSLPLERVELISFIPFFLAFFCANPFFLVGECSPFSPPNHNQILFKKDNLHLH